MAIVWHPCRYIDSTLEHDGSWIDGRWYEWEDIHGNREIARMKLDAIDHFYPETRTIKEEDVCRYREIEERRKMMSPEFDRSFGIIEPEQMEIVKSECGNRYVSITLEDILALITGKVLFVDDGEYTTLVKLTE